MPCFLYAWRTMAWKKGNCRQSPRGGRKIEGHSRGGMAGGPEGGLGRAEVGDETQGAGICFLRCRHPGPSNLGEPCRRCDKRNLRKGEESGGAYLLKVPWIRDSLIYGFLFLCKNFADIFRKKTRVSIDGVCFSAYFPLLRLPNTSFHVLPFPKGQKKIKAFHASLFHLKRVNEPAKRLKGIFRRFMSSVTA